MSQSTENVLHTKTDVSSVETTLAIVSKREDGIIEIRFKKDEYEVDVADQLDIHDACARLTNNGSDPYALLVIPGIYGGITKEAREMEMFDFDVYRNQMALAIVIKALHQRILATLYFNLKRNKPRYPYRLFNSETQAVQWISQQLSIVENTNSKHLADVL
ncbi:MAG: hypothetical protein HYU69_02145 [Bacteroidetes bacterium]|nr:hypothetical protein [Bacteroidota bacterium]